MNNNVKISHKIDGKVIARALNQESSKRVKDFFKEHGYIPKLNVLWIGMDFVSRSYFNVIQKTSSEVGIRFYKSRFFPDVSQKTLEDEIKFLNEDKQISGYIMLLPLSQNLDVLALRAKMIESKDVDGMSLSTTQKIKDGLEPLFWPATALGCMEVIKNQFPGSLKGKTVTVVGLSDIVGMPITKLLLKLDASVLTVDSRTPLDQKVESCQQADIVISCVGRPDQHKILEEHVKSGAMLIDIGMSAQSDTTKKGSFRLVGDIDPTAEEKSSCFVPTLNGVGPVTAAMLVRNLIDAAIQQK